MKLFSPGLSVNKHGCTPLISYLCHTMAAVSTQHTPRINCVMRVKKQALWTTHHIRTLLMKIPHMNKKK